MAVVPLHPAVLCPTLLHFPPHSGLMFPPVALIRDSGGMRLPANARIFVYGESDGVVYSISLQRHPHWWGVRTRWDCLPTIKNTMRRPM